MSAAQEVKVVTAAPSLPTLAGKIAVVTGASRGIGAGIALRLARDGAKVVVNYHKDVKSANAVVAAINSVKGSGAIAVQADVSKSADVDRLFAEAKRVFGRVDIVIANSGVGPNATPIANTTNDDFARVFATNVTGVFYTLRAAANTISDNGRIMVIGSTAKAGTIIGFGPYASTKACVEVLSNTLAQELGARGITVNAIHPGAIDTDMLTAASPTQEMVDFFKNMSPQKRIGTTGDLGDAVALIASDGARWISGQAICVNGAGKF